MFLVHPNFRTLQIRTEYGLKLYYSLEYHIIIYNIEYINLLRINLLEKDNILLFFITFIQTLVLSKNNCTHIPSYNTNIPSIFCYNLRVSHNLWHNYGFKCTSLKFKLYNNMLKKHLK